MSLSHTVPARGTGIEPSRRVAKFLESGLLIGDEIIGQMGRQVSTEMVGTFNCLGSRREINKLQSTCIYRALFHRPRRRGYEPPLDPVTPLLLKSSIKFIEQPVYGTAVPRGGKKTTLANITLWFIEVSGSLLARSAHSRCPRGQLAKLSITIPCR
ncbi:unnamed protein product [Xylocopa violacea]|uniref:Uncharacterized protein n=1 Tax=Xylocopa violacea TaxID=135666 RepID=A0ABP1NR40_XYLVO